MMKALPWTVISAIALATASGAVVSTTSLPANIAAATADPSRAAQAADDPRRHGPEILAFAGVASGARIIDLIPGGAYWTRLFAKAVGPRGHVYGIWPIPYVSDAPKDVAAYAVLAGSVGYRNVSVAQEPATRLDVDRKVDLVFTAQNYHDYPDKFMGSIDPAILNRAVFDALKPGGIYLIIDHAASDGSGMRDTETLHRIDALAVKSQVTAAGFEFVASSPLLANPADDHTKSVFDPSMRGHTDQFIFKFRKPM